MKVYLVISKDVVDGDNPAVFSEEKDAIRFILDNYEKKFIRANSSDIKKFEKGDWEVCLYELVVDEPKEYWKTEMSKEEVEKKLWEWEDKWNEE
jgi:hypothetical protein